MCRLDAEFHERLDSVGSAHVVSVGHPQPVRRVPVLMHRPTVTSSLLTVRGDHMHLVPGFAQSGGDLMGARASGHRRVIEVLVQVDDSHGTLLSGNLNAG